MKALKTTAIALTTLAFGIQVAMAQDLKLKTILQHLNILV